mmetsp:Transcript_2915/g.6526  ORF Transcript_2915/g.6526 Transcript_2915/m.6526 type:complete len:206 (-) Transcript_2915:919-1536(-)
MDRRLSCLQGRDAGSDGPVDPGSPRCVGGQRGGGGGGGGGPGSLQRPPRAGGDAQLGASPPRSALSCGCERLGGSVLSGGARARAPDLSLQGPNRPTQRRGLRPPPAGASPGGPQKGQAGGERSVGRPLHVLPRGALQPTGRRRRLGPYPRGRQKQDRSESQGPPLQLHRQGPQGLLPRVKSLPLLPPAPAAAASIQSNKHSTNA